MLKEGQLTEEQINALEKGMGLRQYYYQTEKSSEGLDALYEAMETMAEYVDDIDDVYYKIVFANIIQDMQDSKKFELSDGCQEIKLEIYIETLKWFETAESYKIPFRPYLWNAFSKLGEILLKGEEFTQNDEVAWICYKNLKLLEFPIADIFLEDFEKNEEGKPVFKGVRPK